MCCSLSTLNLSNNQINDKCIDELVRICQDSQQNARLTHIDLSSNKITLKGANNLLLSIKTNSNIKLKGLNLDKLQTDS